MRTRDLVLQGYDVALDRPAACDCCLKKRQRQPGHYKCDVSQLHAKHFAAWERGELCNEFIGGRWVWLWAQAAETDKEGGIR